MISTAFKSRSWSGCCLMSATESCFALKGGTAINLFIRNMPRLSVDIDLTYIPIEPRSIALNAIDAALKRIADRARQRIHGAHVTDSKTDARITKLLVRSQGVQVKIEVTPVLRGCVFRPETVGVSPMVEDTFGFAEMQLVSFADLYAGKAVAALTGSILAISSTCASFWPPRHASHIRLPVPPLPVIRDVSSRVPDRRHRLALDSGTADHPAQTGADHESGLVRANGNFLGQLVPRGDGNYIRRSF